MKKKLIGIFLAISAILVLAATNAFDNVTVTTSSKMAGVTRMLTNGISGVTVGIWTNGQLGIGQNINPASGYLVDMSHFQDGQSKIRFYNTNTGTSVSCVMQIVADGAGGFGDGSGGINIGQVGNNFSGSTPGNTSEIYAGSAVDNFMLLFQKAGAQFWIQSSTGRKFQITDTQTDFQGGTPIFATNNTVTVSNLLVNANTTIGDASSDTITFNTKTASIPNGLFFDASLYVSNATVSIGTNGISTTSALLVQQNLTNGPAVIIRGTASPNATAQFIQYQTSAGASLGGVYSNGTVFVGLGTFSATGVNGVNAGGTVSFINNTASTGSTTQIGGGTGTGARVTIHASGLPIATFSTNLIVFNHPVQMGTNASIINGIFTIKLTTFDPPSIATLATFSTNFAFANVTTNGSDSIIYGVAPTAGIVYRAYCPSNGFETLDLMNVTALSVDGASQTIGVEHHNLP